MIDDWPLHPAKGINTSLSIGACWQGSENKFKHHFRGYLAGLSLLIGKTEDPSVLACLHKCKESLEVPGMEVVQPGMQLMTNTGKKSINFYWILYLCIFSWKWSGCTISCCFYTITCVCKIFISYFFVFFKRYDRNHCWRR